MHATEVNESVAGIRSNNPMIMAETGDAGDGERIVIRINKPSMIRSDVKRHIVR